MATFNGVILDVSGSMKKSIKRGVNQKESPWACSIFNVIDDLIKHDLSSNNYVFAIGVGAKNETEIIDVIGTIKKANDLRPATMNTIESLLKILEVKGARNIRKWAKVNVIQSAVSENIASLILHKLQTDQKFAKNFVYDCLPFACRDWAAPYEAQHETDDMKNDPLVYFFISAVSTVSNLVVKTQDAFANSVSEQHQATQKDIDEVVAKAKQLLDTPFQYVEVSEASVFDVKEAHEVLHGVVDGNSLTLARSRELLKKIEPFIYGSTPLHESIIEAASLLVKSSVTHANHQRLLFILSDGEPTDTFVNITEAREQLKNADVKTVCCFISSKSSVESRRLFSHSQREWQESAKFLFDLSSTVPTNLVTTAIFIKRDWKIDIDSNETRLFLQVNHPDNLRDACDLARNIVCCQDTLSELLVSLDLDLYINQRNTGIRAKEQVGRTCYANASAAVLHLAMHRILGRRKPDFEALRDEIIGRFGKEGANTFTVLTQICPRYRLRCREVDVHGAMEAIAAKRPVVATFELSKSEWDIFGDFFKKNPNGILRRRDLDISKRPRYITTGGHAVVLTSYNSECFRLMNSWGEEWADNGFFKVKSAEVLGLEFIDVFWTLDDITEEEKEYYRSHGSEVAGRFISLLKSLQVATFTCPLCKKSSLVTEFRGKLSHAICPRCGRAFSSNDGNGNILALNVHLTALSRSEPVIRPASW